LKKDIARHEANCEFSIIDCERCFDKIEINKVSDHDCIKSLHRQIIELKKDNEMKICEIERKYLSKLKDYEEELVIIRKEINGITYENLNKLKSFGKEGFDQLIMNQNSEGEMISNVIDRINYLEMELNMLKNQNHMKESSRNRVEKTLSEEKFKFSLQINDKKFDRTNNKKLYVKDSEENKALLSSIEKRQYCKNGLTHTIDEENLSSSFLNERDQTIQYLKKIYPKPIRGYFQEFFKLDLFNQILSQVKEIVLLFRASEHGFLGKKFHEFCDGKPHNVIFIKSEVGNIFGGYTPLKWNSINNSDLADDSMLGFLFSVTYNTKHPHYNYRDKAIHCYSTFGPIFGGREGSRDLVIYDECHKNKKSHSNLGYSYKLLDGMIYGSDKAREYLGGSTKFKIVEYEVYQLIY